MRDGEGLEVSHLLFANDTLVFCEVSHTQLMYLSWLLMWFEVISGLKINLTKSELILVGRPENLEELALVIGCKVGMLSTTYLGLPLGAPYNSLVDWDEVEERFLKRLTLWKRQYISKGGRLMLIRSTLSSLPIYFLSHIRMPRMVRLRLEKFQRDFLWGGKTLNSKPHLVKWDMVCSNRRKRGLDVKRLHSLNKTLLCKWIWRFALEREAFWRQIIYGKYGEMERGWCFKEARGGFGVGLWKTIRKLWDLVSCKLSFSVGNGKKIKF